GPLGLVAAGDPHRGARGAPPDEGGPPYGPPAGHVEARGGGLGQDRGGVVWGRAFRGRWWRLFLRGGGARATRRGAGSVPHRKAPRRVGGLFCWESWIQAARLAATQSMYATRS